MKQLIASGFLGGLLAVIGLSLMGPRDGNGNYSLPAGNPVVSGTPISSSWANATLSDLATAMASSIAKDGQTVPTANLPMGGFRHTGVGDASARNHYAAAGQVQDASLVKLSSVSGTNTIVGTLTPAITSYSAGMFVVFQPAGNNTGATTLNVNGLGALDVQKFDGDALASGDLVTGIPAFAVLDTGADDWILLNPQSSNLSSGVAMSDLARLSQENTFSRDENGSSQQIFSNTSAGTSASNLLFLNNNAGRGAGLYITGSNFSGSVITGGPSGEQAILNSSGIPFTIGTNDTERIRIAADGSSINLQATTVQVNGQSIRDAAILTSGSVADARISSSSVTQHMDDGYARNITGKAGTTKTLIANASCPPASGGVDGQIWYCY